MSLSLLLDNPEKVLDRWPTDPQLHHGRATYLRSLLTADHVNDLIGYDCLPLGNVGLIQEGGVVDPRTYTDGLALRTGAIAQHLAEGGTVVLRRLEQLVPALADLHRKVSLETGCPTHVNAYYTPAGAQGLKYHFDPYVTVILQVSGSKAWPTHRPFVENPVQEYGSFHLTGFTDDQRHFLEHTPPEKTYVLEAGDVLWLPRGFVHSPYTVGEEPSLHVTLAIKPRTLHWLAAQLAENILAEALVDPAMRDAIPPSALLGDPAPAIADMLTYLVGMARMRDMEQEIRRVRAAALDTS